MKREIEQRLKEALQQPFVSAQRFLEDIIFPVFGDDNFESAGNLNVLKIRHDLQPKANASGITSIRKVGDLLIDGSELGIFDITLDYKKQLQRNRVEVQQIIRTIISTHSGAFIIFHYQSGARWEWRFTFCHKGASNADSTNAKRYTYLLGPGQSCRTAAENFMKLHDKIENEGEFEMDDIIRAFDVEALSKEFFTKYKAHYERFCLFVYDHRHDSSLFGSFFATCEDKIIRDYVKKLLGRLVFLQFLQKKRWLGGKSCQWNDGDTDFLQHLFANASPEQKKDFLDAVLEPLFQNALDTNRAAINQDFDTGVEGFRCCKIPYLNGGLFSTDKEIDEANSDFPPEYFQELFDFFYQYNFTIDENDPNDAEVGIDPEMLGRIFENLLEDNKDKGAFYTPKPIVQYMCRESLIAYLQNGCKSDRARQAARDFVETHDAEPLRQLRMEKPDGTILPDSVLDFFDAMLRKVKICDPAIGSGAFPMGMLRELYDCRSAIEGFDRATAAEIKKDIIQNNIYGVDIEKGAVDIARLRFWLTLILDEEDPKALPNLDFKIMQGNSLLESFHGLDLSAIAVGKQKVTKGMKVNARTLQGSFFFKDEQEAMKEIQQCIRRYYSTESHSAKQMLYAKIENAIRQYLYYRTEGRPDLQAEVETLPLCNDQFFLWHTFFADVFEQGGFDIVIGNPPYIQLQADGGFLGKLYKDVGFETFNSMGDIYCLFYEHGVNLLRERGILCYITSNNWMRAGYGESLREFFTSKCNPLLLVNFVDLQIFDTAIVETNVLLLQHDENKRQTRSVMLSNIDNLGIDVRNHCSIMSFDGSSSWVVLSKEEITIRNKFQAKGTLLSNWDISITNGIKTGYNDAFVISTDQRNLILANCKTEEERKKTELLIQPTLRGRDIKRYGSQWSGLWLIHTHNGKRGSLSSIDINEYPAVKAYLDTHWDKISKRGDKGVTPYNLRNCAYIDDLQQPKVAWIELSDTPKFTLTTHEIPLNTVFFFVGKDIHYLLGLLNSRAIYWYFTKMLGCTSGMGTNRWLKFTMEQLPIPKATTAQQRPIISLVNDILSIKKTNFKADTSALESEIDRLVYELYGLTEDEIKIVEGTN